GLGRDDRQGAADVLGLKEIPQVGGFDLEIERRSLRAFSQRLREGEEEGEDRDQERDALVRMRRMLRVLGPLHLLMRAGHHALLWRLHAPTMRPSAIPRKRGRGRRKCRQESVTRAGGRCDRPRAAAPCRPRYRPAWSRAMRGPKVPG